MKRTYLIALVAALLFGAPAAAGAAPFTFTFDEFGNGRISVNGGPETDLMGSLMADPTQAGNPLALTWLLPASVLPLVNGQIFVHEGSSTSDPLSDVLRFTDSLGRLSGGTVDRMIFYSLVGGGSLADTGLPSNLTVVTPSHAFESNGRFTYDVGNIYNGISDGTLTAVPEPSSLLLLGSGIGFVIRARRKPRQDRQLAA